MIIVNISPIRYGEFLHSIAKAGYWSSFISIRRSELSKLSILQTYCIEISNPPISCWTPTVTWRYGVHPESDRGIVYHALLLDLRFWSRSICPPSSRCWWYKYLHDRICRNEVSYSFDVFRTNFSYVTFYDLFRTLMWLSLQMVSCPRSYAYFQRIHASNRCLECWMRFSGDA